MRSKVLNFVNWGVLIIVTLVAAWTVLDLQWLDDDEIRVSNFSRECVDVGVLEGFKYDACYDAFSSTIFLKVNRKEDNYQINKLIISFVDSASQSYDLDDVPSVGDGKAYKLLANKNPGKINVLLDAVKTSSELFCGKKIVPVGYCPAGTGGGGSNVSISPIDGVDIMDFIDVNNFPEVDSDIIVMDLVEKEKIWETVCKSNWDCGGWEACIDGVEKRSCSDLNDCPVSTDSPLRVRRCDGTCVENWECQWGKCSGGVSVPDCRDLNNCGTSNNKPRELSCEDNTKCVPDVVCGEWSECRVDYNFLDLVGSDKIIRLSGSRMRLCVDEEGCASADKEMQECSMGVDIYTKRFERCGEDYIGVHNALDDSVLAVLKEGRENDNYLNIYFDDKSGVYCDYCYDGEKNGDEEGVDCGGSCETCETRVLERLSWWEGLFRSFGF